MASKANRVRKDHRRRNPAKPRHVKADAVAKAKTAHAVVDLPLDRDGLLWLIQRNKLKAGQRNKALAFRGDYREFAAAGPSVKSFLSNFGGVRGGQGDGPTGKVIYAVDAQRRLFFARFVALRGQADLIDVVDGVCGRGLTLRELAGGNGHKAAALEQLLKVALDLMVEADKVA